MAFTEQEPAPDAAALSRHELEKRAEAAKRQVFRDLLMRRYTDEKDTEKWVDGFEADLESYVQSRLALGPQAARKEHEMTEYERKALARAEAIGVYEYRVNGRFMEYWSFYGRGEGWYFVRYDLDSGKEVFRGANIPWDDDAGIPAFLKTDYGATMYNYMEG